MRGYRAVGRLGVAHNHEVKSVRVQFPPPHPNSLLTASESNSPEDQGYPTSLESDAEEVSHSMKKVKEKVKCFLSSMVQNARLLTDMSRFES